MRNIYTNQRLEERHLNDSEVENNDELTCEQLTVEYEYNIAYLTALKRGALVEFTQNWLV